jgi:hypothetical protein
MGHNFDTSNKQVLFQSNNKNISTVVNRLKKKDHGNLGKKLFPKCKKIIMFNFQTIKYGTKKLDKKDKKKPA